MSWGFCGLGLRGKSTHGSPPGSVTAGQAPGFRVSQWTGHSSPPALWKAFGRGPQRAGLLFALSDN